MPYRAQRHESPQTPPSHAPEERESAHRRGYTKRWQKVRLAWLEDHPLCAECLRKGLTVVATEADHIEPHRGDMAAFWSGELQGLCHTCHSRKTARERRERKDND